MTPESAALREVLPSWAPWACLAWGPVAWLSSVLLVHAATALARRGAERAPDDAHWTERARQAYTSRATASLGVYGSTLAWGVAGWLALSSPVAVLGARAMAVFLGSAAWLGASRALLSNEHRILKQSPIPVPARAVVGLVASPYWVAACLFAWPARSATAADWIVRALGLGVLVVLAAGGTLVIYRLLGVLRPAGERLVALVARAGVGAAVRPRAAFELPSRHANALASMPLDLLVVTSRMLDGLDDDQIVAVLRHELGHLSEPPRAVALRIARALAPLGAFVFSALLEAPGSYLLVVAGLAFNQATLRWSRGMERRADRHAHTSDESPGLYASALEKLYQLNVQPVVLAQKGTHPHLYDRLKAAGRTPDYPRPKPPAPRPAAVSALLFLAFLGLLVGVRSQPKLLPVRWSLALFELRPEGAISSAETLMAEGDLRVASVLLDPCPSGSRLRCRLLQAEIEAASAHCSEARRILDAERDAFDPGERRGIAGPWSETLRRARDRVDTSCRAGD